MSSLGDLVVRVGADIQAFSSAMRTVSQEASDAVDAVTDKLGSLQSVGASLALAGGALTAGLTVPIVGIGKAAVETAASFEQTKIAFTTLLHSSAGAEQMLKSLYSFAAQTPFQIGGILQGARTLTAMGYQAQQIVPMLRTLGDAASGLGLGQEGLERMIFHFGQIQSLGRIDGRILREMGQQGIAAGQMLADGLGKSVPEVLEMITKKQIDAKTATDLLIAGMNKKFGGGMEAQMQSFTGMLSNLKDNITYTKDAIGEQLLPAGKAVIGILAGMSEAVKNGAHVFGELPAPIKYAAIGALALVAAIGPLLVGVGGLIFTIGALIQVWPIFTIGLAAATGALASMAATLTGAVAAGFAALVTGVPAAIAEIAAFSTALLAGAIPSVVTFATVSIPAAISALGAFAISATAAASSLLTLSLTSIPAATRAMIAFATTGIGPALASLRAMALSAVPAVIGVLSVLSVSVAVAAAAFGGWKLGEWLRDKSTLVRELGDAIGNTIMKVPGMVSAVEYFTGTGKGAADAVGSLQASVNRLEAALWKKGIAVEHAGLSLEDYAKKLRAAGLAANIPGVESASAKMAELAKKHKEASEELKAATSNLATVKKAMKAGLADTNDLAEATDRWKAAMSAANPQLHATGEAIGKLSKAAKDLKANPVEFDIKGFEGMVKAKQAASGMAELHAEFLKFKVDFESGDIGKEATELGNKVVGFGDKSTKSITNLAEALKLIDAASTEPFDKIKEAYKTLDIESSASLADAAKKAQIAYALIKNSGVASAEDIEKAFAAMNKAMAKANTKGGPGDFITEMSNNFGTSIQKMLDGTTKFSTGFRNMGVGLLAMWGQTIDKMIAQWLAGEVKKLVMHLATNAGIMTNDTVLAGQQESLDLMQHAKKMLMLAEKAAGAAFSSAMDLPFPVNAVVAPIAAAGAFAGVMALGAVSAEGGADLPNMNTVGMLHPREMVLPRGLADKIRGLPEGGSSRGGNPSLSQTNHYHGAPAMSNSQMNKFGDRSIKRAMGKMKTRSLGI